MNRVFRQLSSSLQLLGRRLEPAAVACPTTAPVLSAAAGLLGGGHRVQWTRGIRVRVRNGNLEQALAVMERKMRSSGMERLIRRQVGHHIKNSEKRVLARKNLQLRLRSEDLARKLQTILIKKIRGL